VSEHPAPVEAEEEPGARSETFGRSVLGLWHRIRAGEDPIAFGAVVVVLALAAGLAWFWAGARHGGVPAASAAPNPSAEGPAPPPAGPSPTTGPSLAVHVAGAVRRPGLYDVPSGARVDDALRVAGGSLPAADLDRLNLAAKLVDGQKIAVTRRGAPAPPDPSGTAAGGAIGGAGPGPAEPVDLNTADVAALDALPGIGPATAQAILEERSRRGGFRSTRDLLRVPGIGEGRFARLKDHVRV
jgi:competence protein ComEA